MGTLRPKYLLYGYMEPLGFGTYELSNSGSLVVRSRLEGSRLGVSTLTYQNLQKIGSL